MLDNPNQGPLDRPIDLTFFKDRNAGVKKDASLSLRALATRILNRNAPAKEELPWLKLATFGNRVTDRGSLRNNDNILSATGVELDYDKGEITLPEAAELLEKAGVACLLYTSPSHKPEFPKWRILAPFSEAMDGPARAHMAGRIAGLFFARYGSNVFDAASWTLSQSFFYGFVVNDEPFHHKVVLVDGEEVDLHDKLDETAIGRPNTATRHNDGGMRATDTSERQPLDLGMAEESILTGDNFHSSLLSIAGHLVARGMGEDDIWEELDRLMQAVPVEIRRANQRRWKQRSSQKHLKGIIAYCLERERKTHRFRDYERSGDQPAEDKPKPEPEQEDDGERKVEPAHEPEAKDIADIDPGQIPERPWLIPRLALRKALTAVVAPGAAGKSTFTVHLAMMGATGQSWGRWTPRQTIKTLFINLEDDQDEKERRFLAAPIAMGVNRPRGMVRLDPSDSLIIAKIYRRHPLDRPHAADGKLRQTIEAGGYAMVVVDPFIETHEANENDNVQMKTAAALWRELARLTNTSIVLVHHSKKGSSENGQDADMSRGASGFINLCRCGVYMQTMKPDEAEKLGLPREDARLYVSISDSMKQNYVAPLDRLPWFKHDGVNIGNGKGFGEGDNVGVLIPWEAPDGWGGLDTKALNKILDEIDQGVPYKEGNPIRYTRRKGDNWAGQLLVDRGLAPALAQRRIDQWIENDVLINEEYLHPKRREMRLGLTVGARPGDAT